MENRLVPAAGIPLDVIDIQGLRRNGWLRWLAAPFALSRALWQVFAVMRRRRPALVIGMGGFVSGPGGLMARLLGIPLLIHEQNAVPGLANRLLAHIATQVLQAFPGSFAPRDKLRTLGNPLRREIIGTALPQARLAGRTGPARLLVIGGSLGAQALNEQVPLAVAQLGFAVDVRHQAGKDKALVATQGYRAAGVEAQVSEFIEDMAEAYQWADVIVCRSGALTVSEIAAIGLPAVLVPYPHAVDDHQTRNGAFLAERGAARIVPQTQLSAQLPGQLRELLSDRELLARMATTARSMGMPDSCDRVADICEEVMAR